MNETHLRKYVRAVLDEGDKVIPMRKEKSFTSPPETDLRKTHSLSIKLFKKLQTILSSENMSKTEPQQIILDDDELLQLLIACEHGDTRAIEAASLYVELLGYYEEMPFDTILDVIEGEINSDLNTQARQLTTDYSGTPGSADHHLTKIK